jgi:hypothetical protein
MGTAGNQSQAGGGSLRDWPVLPDIVIAPARPAHERTEIVFEVRPGANAAKNALNSAESGLAGAAGNENWSPR